MPSEQVVELVERLRSQADEIERLYRRGYAKTVALLREAANLIENDMQDRQQIHDELVNGTPDTPNRIETIRRAKEIYANAKARNHSVS